MRARETNWPRFIHSALYIDTVKMCAKYSIDVILYIALVIYSIAILSMIFIPGRD